MSRIKEFTLPDLGEGLTEGEILNWLVKVGDTVELNQPIVEVETAKAAVEIPAKWAGRITRIFHDAGTTVQVGAPIIAIDTDPDAGEIPPPDGTGEIPPPGGAIEPGMIGGPAPGGRTAVLVGYGPRSTSGRRRPRKAVNGTPGVDAPPAAAATAPPVAPATEAAAPPVAPAPAPPGPAAQRSVPAAPAAARDSALPAAAAPRLPAAAAGVLAKPPVRKLARDLGVDLAGLAGSGPLGSITRDDVQRAAQQAAEPAPARQAGPGFDAERERRVPVKGVRRLTAENMVASAFTAPHVTEFLTVDVTRSMRALKKLRARPEWTGVRSSPLLLAARAVLMAVERHPMVNSTWSAETNEIVVKEYVNLGIAAATDRGLIVPNIKDAGRLSLRELAEALTALVDTARAGRTTPADMSGGTLTITNVGVFGIDTGTPILPPGETAILALGAVRPTPWVHKGKIKVRQVTTLGLSFDHRIVDGELGSRFLADVGAFLSDPEAATLAWT